MYGCVHMCTYGSSMFMHCVCRWTWMSGTFYLGFFFFCLFVCLFVFFLDTRSLIGTPRACRFNWATDQETFGILLSAFPTLSLQTYLILSLIHYISSLINPSTGEHLVYSLSGLCTVCELHFCFSWMCVCLGVESLGFLVLYEELFLQWLYQFLFALLDFIVLVFWDRFLHCCPCCLGIHSVAQAGPALRVLLLPSSQCWDYKCDQCWISLILLHLC